ncbi:MAG: TIGR02302 family protein [Rhizomicrobium sp.]|jgi:uncharacterized protein (TIGR02302 family)
MPLLKWIASLPGLDRSERFIAAARLSLLWERIWPALWPATGIVGAFAAAALFDLFARIPASLHLILLLAALGLAGYFLVRNFRHFRAPDWQESARRVERDSALVHRPITERHDRLAAGSGDAVAEALWRVHMKRLLAAFHRLRLRLPQPGLPARDPYALRYVVLLLVVTGFAIAGPDWSHRLAAGFTPDSNAPTSTALLDAWITPPAYTGEAPIYLERTAQSDKPIAVPAGSELVLRVHEAADKPSLSLDPTPDGGTPNFTGTSNEYGANVRLTADEDVRVRGDGRALGRWHIKAVRDQPPVIAFAAPPSKTERNALKISFTAGDDYGVTGARALIRPVRANGKTVISVDLPLAASSARTVTQTVYTDLTENPLAGLDVDIVLEAKDGAGQTGRSQSARFRLPARVFTNPLARALIEQRQNLALGGDGAIAKAEHTLEALTIAPDRFYANQGGLYLSIRTAYWELRTERDAGDVEQVEAMLWEIASGIEQGGLLSAAAQLRELQQLLSQALAQGAPQEVIDALLQRYRDALARYLQILAENAQPSNGSPPANAKEVSAEDFEKLLKAIQQLAQTGSRDQAQQLLAMMQSLIENMRMANGGGKGDTPGDKALSGAIQSLSDLTGRQRQLLDKTLREKMGAGDPKDGGGKGLAEQQGKLRDDLNKVLKGLGDQKIPTPDSLGHAGHEMGNSQNQLGSDSFDGAGDAEKNALDDMRQAAGALAKSLMEQKGQGQAQGNSHEGEDPLGRAAGGTGPDLGEGVKIPDPSELQRARSILQELRRRAAERGRPQQELDYIDRLLKEF